MTKINKDGWEIKKLGEVATIVSGATPKTNIPEYWGEGHFWITPAEIKEGDIEISKTERTITDEAVAHTNVNLLPEGTVLLSSRAPIGKVAIAAVPMYCNQGFKNCVCKENLYNKYLFYFLRAKNVLLQSLGRGATFKEISKSIVEGIKIPLPPLPVQHRIVDELDEINAIISAKKQQLSKLDELAQSIFYDMFGDPVSNENGWDVKELDKLFKVSSSKRIMQSEWTTSGVPFMKIADIVALITTNSAETSTFISKEKYQDLVNNDLVPKESDILITSRGTLGLCYIVKDNDKFYFQDGMITWLSKNKGEVLSIFVTRLFANEHFLEMINSKANKSTVAYVSISQLSKLKIILPPLPLQETFAARVSAIEEQKSSIAASIEKMQTLLDARMQEYFG